MSMAHNFDSDERNVIKALEASASNMHLQWPFIFLFYFQSKVRQKSTLKEWLELFRLFQRAYSDWSPNSIHMCTT